MSSATSRVRRHPLAKQPRTPSGSTRIVVSARTALHPNTPNPFNPVTTIHFDLAQDGPVTLRIYDVAGRLVRTLVDGPMSAGFAHQVPWNGLDDAGGRVSSGIYFTRLVAGDVTATRRMLVMK
jgi:hypothetical protein